MLRRQKKSMPQAEQAHKSPSEGIYHNTPEINQNQSHHAPTLVTEVVAEPAQASGKTIPAAATNPEPTEPPANTANERVASSPENPASPPKLPEDPRDLDSSFFNEPPAPRTGSLLVPLLLGIIIVLAGVAGYLSLKQNESQQTIKELKDQLKQLDQTTQNAPKFPTQESTPQASPSAKILKPKFVLRNGTLINGLTKRYESKLKDQISDAVVVERENAKTSTYTKSIIIDLSGEQTDQVKQIARDLSLKVSNLPEAEAKPHNADFLIILGTDAE